LFLIVNKIVCLDQLLKNVQIDSCKNSFLFLSVAGRLLQNFIAGCKSPPGKWCGLKL
jgi:hypothetical protein